MHTSIRVIDGSTILSFLNEIPLSSQAFFHLFRQLSTSKDDTEHTICSRYWIRFYIFVTFPWQVKVWDIFLPTKNKINNCKWKSTPADSSFLNTYTLFIRYIDKTSTTKKSNEKKIYTIYSKYETLFLLCEESNVFALHKIYSNKLNSIYSEPGCSIYRKALIYNID